jgi:hypothetical protein
MARKTVDLSGQRFGKLLVLQKAKPHVKPDGQRVTMYKCLCDCGRTAFVGHNKLTSGNTKSCGCLAGRPGGKTRWRQPGKPKKKAKGSWPETAGTSASELRPGGIQNFIAAFVRSCAKDIVNAPPDNTERKHTEKLLQSAYFERITGLDGELLLAKFREEAEKRQQKKRRKNACR